MHLRIRLTGLCLIIPQKVGSRTVYHVLMPETRHHIQHVARITYAGAPVAYDLGCRALDLSGIRARPGQVNLTNVVDAGRLFGRVIDPVQVGDHPTRSVFARVSLAAPSLTVTGDVARHEAIAGSGGAFPPLWTTHSMDWIYQDVVPASLRLILRRLHAECMIEPEITLPAPAGESACMAITYLPPTEIDVKPGDLSPHFAAYRDLFPPGATGDMKLRDVPIGTPSSFTCLNSQPSAVPFWGETAFNCMLAKAALQ
jgi:hypothetical protein